MKKVLVSDSFYRLGNSNTDIKSSYMVELKFEHQHFNNSPKLP